MALHLVSCDAVPAATPGPPLAEQALPQGAFTIRRAEGGLYRLDHPYYGTFAVSATGSEIACAPNELPEWLWQRFLVAQPLPLASLLHGFEPLHASAVGLTGSALLIMGTSGAGKSSVALHLAARGADFLSDDVAALEVRGDEVMMHPGPPLAIVDGEELDRLAGNASAWRRLGEVEGEVRVVLPAAAREPVRVRAVFALARGEAGGAIEIVPPRLDWATLLLGGTFIGYLTEPRRLARQLDVGGRLAERVQLHEVRVPPGVGAAAVAEAIRSAAG